MSLTYQELNAHVSHLMDAALMAADPGSAVREVLGRDKNSVRIANQVLDLSGGKLYLVAVGKASLAMSLAAIDILGDIVNAGIVLTKHSQSRDQDLAGRESMLPESIQLLGGGHPISDSSSVQATRRILDLLESTTENDIVLCLISGGTSALLTEPRIPLEEWKLLIDALISSGCSINELNAVRKQMDGVKGGGLARAAYPAHCYSLILSDVVGNPLDVIGSGPTVENSDPPLLARHILDRYSISDSLEEDVWNNVEAQLRLAENATEHSRMKSTNIIVGDVRRAAAASVRAAKEMGFSSKLLTVHLEGEAREIGKVAGALAKDADNESCLVLAGETTVTVKGNGKGGRNQELALAAAISLDGTKRTAIVSFATDGEDGPTDSAGATVTGDTIARARSLSVDPLLYLDRNDSYGFFEQVGGHLRIGATGTNVNDLIIILKYGQ